MYIFFTKVVHLLQILSIPFYIFVRIIFQIKPKTNKAMSVNFKLLPKQNNLGNPPTKQYYPIAINSGQIGLEELSEQISYRSSLSKADCYAVVIALAEVLTESLCEGKIVKIDKLGNFRLSIHGEAASDQGVYQSSKIKSTKLLYKPALYIKSRIKNLTFKRI